MMNHNAHFLEIIKTSGMQFILIGTFVVHFLNTSLPSKYIRLIEITYGLMECRLYLHIMIAHVTNQPFPQYRLSILMTCGIALGFLILTRFIPLNEVHLVWGLLIFNLIGK
jgi:hypothetical protein